MLNSPLRPGAKIELLITGLAVGGDGVGRHEGQVVFVPFSCAGDLAEVEITENKKSFLRGEVVRVLKESPERRTPPCPVFGQCGGCVWQHVSYEEQLRQKQLHVERLARSISPEAIVKPIVGSPKVWNYRNRIQLHARSGKLGFLTRKSHDIVPINDCAITDEKIVNHLKSHRQELIEASQSKDIEKFELRLEEDGAVSTIWLGDQAPAFRQINVEINNLLQQSLLREIQNTSVKKIYDLYCGAGNFGLFLAQNFPDKTIFGVEKEASLLIEAKKKVTQLRLRNLQFHTADVKKYLGTENLGEGLVILDPPRMGCDRELLSLLKNSTAEALIYISCHPATAARDWKLLAPRFSLHSVQAFDMFPQTDHVELIAVLR
ncbi:MAG: class I SAM-dependent RNA methyltransferase [Bdellovibrionales bacterium]